MISIITRSRSGKRARFLAPFATTCGLPPSRMAVLLKEARP